MARQCLRAFKQLRFNLEQPGRKFGDTISTRAMDDEMGRFMGWASNLGALQTGRSSLDFRLGDVTFLFDHVVTLLGDLEISLREGLDPR